MNDYFSVGGCMSERIRHRCEKTSRCTPDHLPAGGQNCTGAIGIIAMTCFFVTRPYA